MCVSHLTYQVIFSTPAWQLDDLQNFKASLNHTKDKLDDKILGDWSRHTSERRPTENVCTPCPCG